jgi:fimbrial chaperone protein
MRNAGTGGALMLATAAFLASSGSSHAAGAINIAPTRLELNARSRYTSFTLTNSGNMPMLFQVEAHAWTQKGNDDLLTPTRDLIVAPPVLSIDAGTARIVRVALRDVQPGARELSYRLIVSQVPDKVKAPGLRFIYQLNVPLFVAPASAVQRRLAWSARLDHVKRRIAVTIENVGNVHFRIDELRLYGGFGGNVPLGSLKDSHDVLAGAMRVYDVALYDLPQGSAITVEALASGEPAVRAVVSLTP